MKPNSKEGRKLKEIEFFIVDEASMLSGAMLATMDTVLKDLNDNTEPFGGPSNSSQCWPIPAIRDLKNCVHFRLFQQIRLTRNMRVEQDQIDWMRYLLRVGNGTLPQDESGKITLLPGIMSAGDLIQETFDGSFDNPDSISKRAILCPKNKDVDRVNNTILERMRGEVREFHSVDCVDADDDGQNFYPIEFLNKQNPSNLPPHTLRLKKGAVVLLLRNLNVKDGLF